MLDYLKLFGIETLATMIFIILGNGVMAGHLLKGTKGRAAGFSFPGVALGWGLAVGFGSLVGHVLINVLNADSIKNINALGAGHVNPIVTIAFFLKNVTLNNTLLMFVLFAGQIIGACLGQILLNLFYWAHIKTTYLENPEFILYMHATSPQNIKNHVSNSFAEFLASCLLVFVVLLLSNFLPSISNGEFLTKTILVVFLITILVIALGGITGCALNPVRDFIPRLVYLCLPLKNKPTAEWSYAWIPVVFPTLGALCAFGFFKIFC